MSPCPKCGEDNPERANFCLACGTPLRGRRAPERRKLATVLFCDVSGSTTMAERLDAESVRDLMFRYFHEMRSAVEQHGGTVEKFIGDAVVAVFGVPVAHEDDALRALRAAVDMQRRALTLNEELERRFGSRIVLRIGVNTGEVFAGEPMGDRPAASGDPVNVAARLEQTAKPGEILIGERTYRLTRDAISAEPVAPLELKGKSELVPAYRLLSLLPASATVQRRLDAEIVGRRRELALLERAFARCIAERRSHRVVVAGQPGVGKSRLAAEFLHADARHATILRGRFLSYGEGITYWPLIEAVRQAAGIRDEHAPEPARARIKGLVADEADGEVVAELIATGVGLGERSASPEEIAWAARKLLVALARERPLVFLLDDLQWAEETFLDLVDSVAALTPASVFLLGLARPELLERRPAWREQDEQTTLIELEPLSEAESAALVDRGLGRAALAADVRERVIEAAGGNPLFIEELLAMLVDEGLLHLAGGRWVPVEELPVVPIPPTIDALIESRLDLLADDERQAVERAAVEGKLFHRGAVEALSPPDKRGGVHEALQALTQKELVQPAAAAFAGEAAFRFRHLLIRDVAYRSTPKKVRADLHERFAVWLEARAGGRATEQDEIIGYHLEQAYRYREELGPIGDDERVLGATAASRLEEAGQRALARGDLRAATNLLERATSLLHDDDPARVALLPQLGAALTEAGRLAQADIVLAEGLDRARAAGDQLLEARALVEQLLLRLQVDVAEAMRDVRRAGGRLLNVFEKERDAAGLWRLWHLRALVHWYEGSSGMAAQAWERAALYARRIAEDKLAEVLVWLPACALFGPTPAAEGIRRCEEIREQLRDNRRAEASMLPSLAGLYAMTGRYELAFDLIAQTDVILADLGLTMRSSAPDREAYVAMLAGEPAQAEERLRAGYERLAEMGEKALLASTAALLAHAVYAQGRYEEAYSLTEVCEEAAATEDVSAQIGWRAVRGKILAKRGSSGEAEALARQAVALAERTDFLTERADALLGLAEILRGGGRLEGAAAAAREGLELYERKGNLVGAAEARSLLDEHVRA